MKNDSGCLDCTERKPMCHAQCEKYLNYKKKLEKIKEQRRLAKQEDSMYFNRKRRVQK